MSEPREATGLVFLCRYRNEDGPQELAFPLAAVRAAWERFGCEVEIVSTDGAGGELWRTEINSPRRQVIGVGRTPGEAMAHATVAMFKHLGSEQERLRWWEGLT